MHKGGCYANDECQGDLTCDINSVCPASLGFDSGVSCCTSELVCTGNLSWNGDGYCDDLNNTEGCQWDDGDCCGGDTTYCSVCECLDPSA